jgi:diaminopimelate dehydrogenase
VSEKIRVAIAGFGNVGKEVLEALQAAPDMECAGIVLRNPAKVAGVRARVGSVPVTVEAAELGRIDVAALAIASRAVPEEASKWMERGVRTVDSFDIHGPALMELRSRLDAIGRRVGIASVISAGWDPGTDSMVRGIFEIIAPKGITYTNFGPGMSMGHTVAVKAIEGVEEALSLTIPIGTGLHRRMVYVKAKPGADFDQVAAAIKADPYFVHDETHVLPAESIDALEDMGHGVHMERKGVSGTSHNQRLELVMSLQNPAATAQVMVCSARATMRLAPGCYTMLEIPIADFLPGGREALVRRLC